MLLPRWDLRPARGEPFPPHSAAAARPAQGKTPGALVRDDTGRRTAIVTTAHHLQVVDEALPETEHDFSVDLIVTPGEVIECVPPRRPGGFTGST